MLIAGGDYFQTVREWQVHREAGLRAPDSWLALVGLFWLKPGVNTIGSGSGNDFVLPRKSAPEHVGKLLLSNGAVTFIGTDGSQRQLTFDEEHPDIVKAGTVSFYAIKRGDRLGIRVKDSQSPTLKSFSGTEFFKINPELHFEAHLIPDEKTIPIHNVLGQIEQQKSPGVVEFRYRGQTYRLRPIFEGKTLFFLFKDPTNRSNTYQGGRMLNTPLPVNGKVNLDFNRSYNPPCTFTPFATCPLPPKENTLPFPVEAGEKRYHSGHAEYSTN